MRTKKNATLNVGFKEKQPSSRKSVEKKPQKLTESDLRNLMGIKQADIQKRPWRSF